MHFKKSILKFFCNFYITNSYWLISVAVKFQKILYTEVFKKYHLNNMLVKVLRQLCTKLHNFFFNLVELWNKHGVRKNGAHVPVVSVLKNKFQGLQTVRSTLIWFKCVANSCQQGEKAIF